MQNKTNFNYLLFNNFEMRGKWEKEEMIHFAINFSLCCLCLEKERHQRLKAEGNKKKGTDFIH